MDYAYMYICVVCGFFEEKPSEREKFRSWCLQQGGYYYSERSYHSAPTCTIPPKAVNK